MPPIYNVLDCQSHFCTQILSTRWRIGVDWACVKTCARWMSLTPKAFGPLITRKMCIRAIFNKIMSKLTSYKIHFFCQMRMFQMDLISWCCWRVGIKYTIWVSLNANTYFSILIINITYEYVLFFPWTHNNVPNKISNLLTWHMWYIDLVRAPGDCVYRPTWAVLNQRIKHLIYFHNQSSTNSNSATFLESTLFDCVFKQMIEDP